jgi:hypothetical protein
MLTIALATALLAANADKSAGQPPEVERFGIYLVSDDVQRSSKFFAMLLAEEPQVRLPDFIGFDVAGGLLALVDRSRFAADAKRGDTAVPYIKVNDVQVLLAHVRKVAPQALVTQEAIVEGSLSIIKIRDPDGNLLEFFSLKAAR